MGPPASPASIADAAAEPLLAVENLRVAFAAEGRRVLAVDALDLNLARGRTLGVVGESGCGKSATALALMNLLPRAGRILEGRMRFDGTDLRCLSTGGWRRLRGRRMAMIFQDPMTALTPYLTVGRQLCEPLHLHLGLDRTAARARARDLLRDVGLEGNDDELRRYPHQFSGGQRQRILISMALACEPELLIADEPTTALDVTIQAQILVLLRELQQKHHLALLLITHDLGVVAGTCDRVAVMYCGRVVEEAPTERIFTNPHHPYTRGLLAAVPRLRGTRGDDLATIPGAPPQLHIPWQGCAFAPRCPWAEPACREETAHMRTATDGVRHRCRVDPTGTGFPVHEPGPAA